MLEKLAAMVPEKEITPTYNYIGQAPAMHQNVSKEDTPEPLPDTNAEWVESKDKE
jgi:hypothetical protein